MRKVIAAINMTLDGYFDHTAITPDEEIHRHYTDLLSSGDVILYGRITYQLMEYWQTVVKKPTGNKAMDDFAVIMDRLPKILFSRTLKTTGWESAALADRSLEETVGVLKQQPGKDILVGSRSLILQLLKLNLVDELQLCVHPVVAGSGLPLFENVTGGMAFKRLKTKSFDSGALLFYYLPVH